MILGCISSSFSERQDVGVIELDPQSDMVAMTKQA